MAKKQEIIHRISFNPIVGENPKTLILSVAPSEKYIEQGQYYSNPNDCFWDIIPLLVKAPSNLVTSAYNTKLFVLKNAGIALWDVIKECDRTGATNKDIVTISCYNDIPAFLDKYKSIENIVFNGKDAYTYFKRYLQAKFPNVTNLKRFLKKRLVLAQCSAARTTDSRDKIIEDWKKKVAPLFQTES